MKKLLLPCTIAALFFIAPMVSNNLSSALAQTVDLNLIKIKDKVGGKESRKDIMTNPLEAWIDGGTLVFLGAENISNMSVIITDLNNDIVLNTVIDVYEGKESEINLPELDFGSYKLHVIIDDEEYSARFIY